METIKGKPLVHTPDEAREAEEAKRNQRTLADDGVTKYVVDKDDPRYENAIKGRFCGNCRHHRIDEAQKDMIKQRFIERLVHEEDWKPEWFKNWGAAGYCDFLAERLIAWEAPAVLPASDLDSALVVGSSDGMVLMPCPNFVSKAEKGGIIISSKHGVTRDRYE